MTSVGRSQLKKREVVHFYINKCALFLGKYSTAGEQAENSNSNLSKFNPKIFKIFSLIRVKVHTKG